MRGRLHLAAAVAAAATLLAPFGGAVRADRIHLAGGGTIEVDSWRTEGDMLVYEGPAGTVGIPRSLVVRVERVESSTGAEAGVGRGRAPRVGVDREREPGGVIATMLRARRALDRRDHEEASAAFRRVLDEDPSISAARVGFALAEMALGRDERALPVVLDGVARDPEHADLHEVLGELRDRGERVEDAVRAWKQAFRLAPNDRLREKILKGERELAAGRYYDYTPTAHFNLRYERDLDPGLARAVHDYLEDSYTELADRFRHAPPQPITVLLYPRREFRQVTEAPESVAGLYDGKIRVPLGGLDRLDPRARRLLVHELTHAVVHSKTRGHCPRWLHEGLAQLMEGRKLSPAHRADVERRLASGEPGDWAREGFSYPAALSLTLFVEREWGFAALVDLLEELGRGSDVDSALEEALNEDYAGLTRLWSEAVLEARR